MITKRATSILLYIIGASATSIILMGGSCGHGGGCHLVNGLAINADAANCAAQQNLTLQQLGVLKTAVIRNESAAAGVP